MKTMTVRGIDEELMSRLRQLSKASSTSINTTILEILREVTGLKKKKFQPVHHDLDHLAGTWTDKDKEEFDRAIEPLSKIDEDMWK